LKRNAWAGKGFLPVLADKVFRICFGFEFEDGDYEETASFGGMGPCFLSFPGIVLPAISRFTSPTPIP